MNQILYTGGKNKKGKMTDIQKIIIFFVIFIIIFGICVIGVGSNLISKVKNKDANQNVANNTTNTTPEPEKPSDSNLKVDFKSQIGGVQLTLACDINIAQISYWWDEEVAVTKEIGATEHEMIIPSKQGTHTLNVEIVNEDGYIKKVSKIVIGDAGPEVTITTDRRSNYIIKAKDDQKVEKIVIVLNGETQEIKVNEKEIEHKVPIPQGDSYIEVTVYNINGLTQTKKAKITNFGV